jgi:hypothetical protein
MTEFAVDRDYGSREALACCFIYSTCMRTGNTAAAICSRKSKLAMCGDQRAAFSHCGPAANVHSLVAPAVLLHLDLAYVEALLRRAADDPSVNAR